MITGLPTPSPVVATEQGVGVKTCVTMDIDTGKFKTGICETDIVKPFVCKKKVVVEACPTVDSGKYLLKCYLAIFLLVP